MNMAVVWISSVDHLGTAIADPLRREGPRRVQLVLCRNSAQQIVGEVGECTMMLIASSCSHRSAPRSGQRGHGQLVGRRGGSDGGARRGMRCGGRGGMNQL